MQFHQTFLSDRGPQFNADLWASVSNAFGSKLYLTTYYHPHIEWPFRTFPSPYEIGTKTRTAIQEDVEASSAELVYGITLTVLVISYPFNRQNYPPSELFSN
ncbi:hypothetical protein RF11_06573 [Thelohanellus kitauei]|uniref:Integrase catalytic domain-containing protein n=1 Tax=Thelohanellus kitauei TaxID=669202 RepID=A0A0C2NEJ5_THEKT|nr:hypothetical protein RF11_06573 [Thelohanellus kitauei]